MTRKEFSRQNPLVQEATDSALARLPRDAGRTEEKKVVTAIKNRFAPYIEESTAISRQLNREGYQAYKEYIEEYLDTTIGAVICPDGRISVPAIFDPRVARVHRRLAGKPDVRQSTDKDRKSVIDDATITAAISSSIQERQEAGKSTDVVEFIGPHIYSTHPEHGCGAAKAKTTATGRPATLTMKHGAVKEYFQEYGFYAFNNVAEDAGGTGWTYDMTHDIHSQGLIFGLRGKRLEQEKSLAENLLTLQESGEILMTEMLDPRFEAAISDNARIYGIDKLNLRNPNELAQNMMTIGQIAKRITQQEEDKGFPWIPQDLKEGRPENVLRTLGYHAIRNSTNRILGGIAVGAHDLLEHPEQLIRVGPVGAAYNVETIPFTQVTPGGELREKDVDGVKALYTLSEGILPQLGVRFEEEGRVIVVTGEHTASDYAKESIRRKALMKEKSVVSNNVAKLQEVFPEGVASGDTVVIGMVYDKTTAQAHIV